jgi:hypothetical protein
MTPVDARRIRFFVKLVGMEQMKAVKIESMLGALNWQTNAVLNQNRQIDRQHAVAALPSCDYFVTSDRETHLAVSGKGATGVSYRYGSDGRGFIHAFAAGKVAKTGQQSRHVAFRAFDGT